MSTGTGVAGLGVHRTCGLSSDVSVDYGQIQDLNVSTAVSRNPYVYYCLCMTFSYSLSILLSDIISVNVSVMSVAYVYSISFCVCFNLAVFGTLSACHTHSLFHCQSISMDFSFV